MIVLFAVLIHIGLLVILKYTGFFGENINNLLALFNTDFRFKIPKICIPIGISFYTLQGLSYIFDVYKGKINADDNLELCLWLFFLVLWKAQYVDIAILQKSYMKANH